MSIKLMMEVNRAHERLDALEKQETDADLRRIVEVIQRVERLEGELKAMKARAGRTRELSDV